MWKFGRLTATFADVRILCTGLTNTCTACCPFIIIASISPREGWTKVKVCRSLGAPPQNTNPRRDSCSTLALARRGLDTLAAHARSHLEVVLARVQWPTNRAAFQARSTSTWTSSTGTKTLASFAFSSLARTFAQPLVQWGPLPMQLACSSLRSLSSVAPHLGSAWALRSQALNATAPHGTQRPPIVAWARCQRRHTARRSLGVRAPSGGSCATLAPTN